MKCSLAFDNSPSMRSVDENGFMRVASSHITKETVNPYYGREIPGWEELGLDPNHIYYGYRAGDELKKAAPTFEGLPLLLGHHVESADAPQKEYRVGSTGTDATWNAPYLDNSLFITDSNAIRMVEDGHMKELSCAYYYEPDFTPGKFEGVPYDFVMRHIRGNHIALVEEGRAGADVVVADAQIKTDNSLRKTMSRLFDRFKGAFDKAPEEDIRKDEAVAQDENQLTKVLMLINAFVEKMPPEEVEELAHKLNDIVTPKEEEAEVKEEVKVEEPVAEPEAEEPISPKEAVVEVEREEEAKDEEFEVPEAVKYGEEVEREREEREEIPGGEDEEFDTPEAVEYGEEVERDRLMKEHMKQAADACGMDAESPEFQKAFAEGVKYGERMEKKEPKKLDREHESEGMKAAMDAAIKSAKTESVKHFRALSSAADATRYVLGNIDPLAFDSADDIYGAALKKSGVDIKAHPKSAWRSMFSMIRGGKSSLMGMDAAIPTGNYEGPFAGLNRIKN